MTSWSQLIEKIQQLCDAFEEDLATNCCQLSERAASLSDQVSTAAPSAQLITQQLNCHGANITDIAEPRSSLSLIHI